MATPADQRLLELLDKWLASLELHTRYCTLDAVAYAQVQPWPEHQRPSRWIIDLARQKALALRNAVEVRIRQGDSSFAESLELMMFLANLVGAEHIERFIPLADPARERAPQSAIERPVAGGVTGGTSATGTREMPVLTATSGRAQVGMATVVRTERKPTTGHAAPAAAAHPGAAHPGAAHPAGPPLDAPAGSAGHDGPSDAARDQVIADAARLIQWGRKWYELAEVIARMADRPHVTDVRRILKDNKSVIDEKAGMPGGRLPGRGA